MLPHSIESELGEKLDIETPKDHLSQVDAREGFLRSIKKIGKSSLLPAISPPSDSVRLYFPERKGYAQTVDLTTRYVEQTGKFRENADQEVFLIAKGGDPVALAELIYRAVSRNEAYVISATRSICKKDPDFEPGSILTRCLCKVLGPDNSRFQKKVESATHFLGGFHDSLENRIKDGYRKWGSRPLILPDSQMGADGDQSSMENLSNEQGLYPTEDQEKDRYGLILRVAAQRCLNAKESEHLRLYAEGFSTQERRKQLGFDSVNATDLSILHIKRKLKGYIKKHPGLFDL